jgi:hypothetical protein
LGNSTRLASLGDFPAADIVSRLAWAGDRMWDLSEGIIPPEECGILWALIVGWADLCTADERRQYLDFARLVQELQEGLLSE